MKARTKQCNKCRKLLPLSEFYKRKDSRDGLRSYCKKCKNAACNAHYASNREKTIKRTTKYSTLYRKTKQGFLCSTYTNMNSRVRGKNKDSLQYKNLPIMSRQAFYDWALADPAFHRLFEAWEISGYELKLTPSIDRIDSSLGYSSDNVQWLTFSDNSKKG